MKQLRYIIPAGFLFFSVSAMAQTNDSTSIRRDVTIQKDYTPSIQDAGKINEIPSVVDPEIKKIEVNYSPYSSLISPAVQIKQLESARLTTPPPPSRRDGLLRLGMGNKWATLGDLMLPIINKETQRLDLNLNHRGMFYEKMHHDNKANLVYNRYSEKSELSLQAGYEFEGFNYYGSNKLDSASTYINSNALSFTGNEYLPTIGGISTWKMAAGYKTKAIDSDYNFTASLDYDGFAAMQGLQENSIITQLYYDKKIDENKAGIAIQLQNLFYGADKLEYSSKQSNYSIFTLNPYFAFEQAKWNLRVGVKSSFAKDAEGKGFAPSADIVGQATLVDKAIFVYGGITGDYRVNSMNYMSGINRYMNLNNKIKDTYTPFDVHGGLKIKLLYNFLIDLSAGYKTIKNQYFFINEPLVVSPTNTSILANNFAVVYQNANLFDAGLRMNYNFNNFFSFIIDGKYHKWDLENNSTAWHMPKYELKCSTDMKLTKKTSVNISYNLATGRQAMDAQGQAVDMDAISDLNFGFFYAHSSKVSSFLKLNNIFGSDYAMWNGYEVVGFNAMFGLAFSF